MGPWFEVIAGMGRTKINVTILNNQIQTTFIRDATITVNA